MKASVTIINKSAARIAQKPLKQVCALLFKRFKCKKELTITFLKKAEAKKINRQFRGKNYATDVLSFDDTFDIILCEPVVRKQAAEHELSFQEEVVYLVIHGFLHLLGYDHMKPKDEKVMMGLQDRLFAQSTQRTKQRK